MATVDRGDSELSELNAQVCSHCVTKDPVGGLIAARRRSPRLGSREEVIKLCEVCYETLAGGKFAEGGQPDDMVTLLAQLTNVLRKDIQKLREELSQR